MTQRSKVCVPTPRNWHDVSCAFIDRNIIEYVTRYASNNQDDNAGDDDESEGEMSSVGDFNSDAEDEPAGAMEDV